MRRTLVWDAPTRVLHFGIAATLLASLAIGLTVDDESPFFVYHMLSGLAAGFLVGVRVLLGILGSRYARFSSWAWSPAELLRYVKNLPRRDGPRYPGHNPGTTWMAILVFAAVGLLIATGLAGGGERFEDLHEALAYGVAGLIALHLAGIAVHTVRRRENIAWSMVDGRRDVPAEAGLSSSHRIAGTLVTALAAVGIVGIFRGYDPATHQVRLPLSNLAVILPGEHGTGKHVEHDRSRERRAERARRGD